MLVAQSAMSRAGGKPFLAVNHIRDQLIPPQERKKKAKVWSKVVDYIRYLLPTLEMHDLNSSETMT